MRVVSKHCNRTDTVPTKTLGENTFHTECKERLLFNWVVLTPRRRWPFPKGRQQPLRDKTLGSLRVWCRSCSSTKNWQHWVEWGQTQISCVFRDYQPPAHTQMIRNPTVYVRKIATAVVLNHDCWTGATHQNLPSHDHLTCLLGRAELTLRQSQL